MIREDTHLVPSHIQTSPVFTPGSIPIFSGSTVVPVPYRFKIPRAFVVSVTSLPITASCSAGIVMDEATQLVPFHIQTSPTFVPGVTPIRYGLPFVPLPCNSSTPRLFNVSAISFPITLSCSVGNTTGLETQAEPSHIQTSPRRLPRLTPMVYGFAEVPFPFRINIPRAKAVSETSFPIILSCSKGNCVKVQLVPSHTQISFRLRPGLTPMVYGSAPVPEPLR